MWNFIKGAVNSNPLKSLDKLMTEQYNDLNADIHNTYSMANEANGNIIHIKTYGRKIFNQVLLINAYAPGGSWVTVATVSGQGKVGTLKCTKNHSLSYGARMYVDGVAVTLDPESLLSGMDLSHFEFRQSLTVQLKSNTNSSVGVTITGTIHKSE